MSLTSEQRANTIREFRENMRLLGLTAEQIGADFGVSGQAIERIIDLRTGVLEYPWIVRGYLLDKAAAAGVTLVPFTALRGDPHDYWFLDDRVIDANRLSLGGILGWILMCRCFAVDLDWNAIAAQFGVENVESDENVNGSGDGVDAASLPRPSYNVRPGQTIAVMAQGRDGRRHLTGARWSLVPSWSSGPALTYPTYNARIESATVKPTFAESTRSMRAVIPASGYYEFRGRRPFYFHAPDDRPLAMAGLFSWWRSGSSSATSPVSAADSSSSPNPMNPPRKASPWILTATILTCPAVDGPATIHDRMPALVPSDMTSAWLDRSIDGSSLLADLASNGTALSRRLAFYEVAPFAPTDDGRRIIRPLVQAEAPTLF